MIKLTDTKGINTVIFPDSLRYVDITHNEDKTTKVLFHYMDSAEVTLTINSVEEEKLYNQLDKEIDSTYNTIELKSNVGYEYIVSLHNIKYVSFSNVKDSDNTNHSTRNVSIKYEDGSLNEFPNITIESCNKLKDMVFGELCYCKKYLR